MTLPGRRGNTPSGGWSWDSVWRKTSVWPSSSDQDLDPPGIIPGSRKMNSRLSNNTIKLSKQWISCPVPYAFYFLFWLNYVFAPFLCLWQVWSNMFFLSGRWKPYMHSTVAEFKSHLNGWKFYAINKFVVLCMCFQNRIERDGSSFPDKYFKTPRRDLLSLLPQFPRL